MTFAKNYIISDLNNFFFPYIFNREYAEHFIERIKFVVLNDLNKKFKVASKEEAIQLTINFLQIAKLSSSNLSDITYIETSYLENLKEEILNSFNPNYYKESNSNSKISLEDALLNYLYMFYTSLSSEKKAEDKQFIKNSIFYSFETRTLLKENKIQKTLTMLRKTKQTKEFDKNKILIEVQNKLRFIFLTRTIISFLGFTYSKKLYSLGFVFDFEKSFEDNYNFFNELKIKKAGTADFEILFLKKEEILPFFLKTQSVWFDLKKYINS